MNTITLLQEFAEQRPGLEFGNYGCRQSYASERRTIQKQLRHARLILEACNSLGVSDECWNYAMETDRLKIRNGVVDFTACQYFPTEYRLAVCRVAMSAIWAHFLTVGCKTRGEIARNARKHIPAAIVRRWFS
jgi:hypothetical protein